MRALDIAPTGLLAQQTQIDVISNNLANASTTAFKASRANFQDLIYQQQVRSGISSSDSSTIIPTGVQLGLGVNTGSVARKLLQGALESTGNDFDVAIQGKGFFEVQLPDGTIAYTRDGSFGLNANGEVVTAQGYIVEPAITIPDGAIDVTINRNGQVFVTLDGVVAPQQVGQLNITKFINEAGLESIGDNLLIETDASGGPIQGTAGEDGFGETNQGFLETSNVDAVIELTSLITAQRVYGFNTRVITAADQILERLDQV